MNLIFDDGAGYIGNNEIYLPNVALTVNIPGIELPESALLVDFAYSRGETIDVLKCFEDSIRVYAFGDNPAESSAYLTMIVLLGRKCGDGLSSGMDGLMNLRKSYENSRVYNKMGYVKASIGTFVFSGYLNSVYIGSVDTTRMLCTVRFSFSQLERDS